MGEDGRGRMNEGGEGGSTRFVGRGAWAMS